MNIRYPIYEGVYRILTIFQSFDCQFLPRLLFYFPVIVSAIGFCRCISQFMIADFLLEFA